MKLRWLLYGVGGIFITVFLFLAVAFALLQTQWGKNFTGNRLSHMLSSPPHQTILLKGLDGFLPFDIRLERLTMGDAEGDWLMAEDITLRWSPISLLSGKIRVKEISARTMEIDRGPMGVEEVEREAPAAPPRFPSWLSALVLEKVSIPQLSLGERLLGHAAVFSIDGGLTPGEERHDVSAALNIERIDPGPETKLDMRATLHAESSQLALKLTFDEEPDGWVASVADLEEAGPLHARIAGDGPLYQWTGDFRLEAGRYASARGDLNLQWTETIAASLEGDLETAPDLLPQEWKPLLGSRALYSFNLRSTPGVSVAMDHGRIETEGFRLESSGEYVYGTQSVQGAVSLHVPTLRVMEGLLEEPLDGKLSLETRIDGTPGAPNADSVLTVERLVFGDVSVEQLDTQWKVVSREIKQGTATVFHVSGTGSAREITSLSLETLPETFFTWAFQGDVPREGPVTIEELAVRGERSLLEVSGHFDPQTLESALRGHMELQDLKDFQVFTGMEHAGQVRLHAQLDSQEELKQAAVRVEGEAFDLQGFPPQLSSLMGSRMELSGSADLREGELLDIPAIHLKGEGFSLQARGHMNMAEQSLRGDMELSLPDLQVLSEAVDRPLSGSATLQARATGLFSALEVHMVLESDQVIVDGEAFELIHSEFRGTGIPEKPTGNFFIHVHKDAERLSLTTDYIQEDEKLYLNNFRVTGPGTEVEGDVIFHFTQPLVDGRLSGTFKDLEALGEFLGTELRGTAQFSAHMRQRAGLQDLSLQLDGERIGGAFGDLSSITVKADLQNVLESPQGDARAQLKGFTTPGLSLHELSLTAKGDGRSLDFEMAAEGEALSPFDVAARGELFRTPEEERLVLTSLQGNYDEHPFQLQAPLNLRRTGEAIAFSGLDLRLGEARLTGEAFLDPGRVDVEAHLAALPMSMLADFGAPELEGKAHATLTLSGAPSMPDADLNLRLENLRSRIPDFRDVPPAFVTTEATIVRNRLESRLAIEGLFPEPATATLALPLRLSLIPFDFHIPPTSPLEGRLTGRADLHALMSLFPQEDHRVRGLLNADLHVGGVVENPQLTGQVTMSDGYYENWATGTVLDQITFLMTAEDNRLVIQELRATDGQRGTLEGQGRVELEAERFFPFEISLRMSNATLVRRDDFTGTLGGSLEISGAMDRIDLGGNLVLAPAEIDVGRPMAPAVTRLEVIEINEHRIPEAPLEEVERAVPMAINLDLVVRMPNRVFVRGRGLDSEWQGNLQVRGSAREPSLLGNLEIVRGHFDFLDQRFQITRGIISFDGMYPPSPLVDMSAEARGRDVLARLLVTGPAISPSIDLESDPQLPQDEILARLLFGRNLSQITPMQGIRLAQAARSLLGDNGEPGIMERARRILGVDRLEVREGLDVEAPAAVGIGRYLSEDIYLDIQRDISGQAGRARVEVEITPNITLEGQAGSDASTGLGINWKYEY